MLLLLSPEVMLSGEGQAVRFPMKIRVSMEKLPSDVSSNSYDTCEDL